jgi:hypothetical protein
MIEYTSMEADFNYFTFSIVPPRTAEDKARIITQLSNIPTPLIVKDKVIFVYLADYDTGRMNFYKSINANKLNKALGVLFNVDNLHYLSTEEEPFPTSEHRKKYVMIPAPKCFNANNPIYELKISDSNVKIFPSRDAVQAYMAKHNPNPDTTICSVYSFRLGQHS